MDNSEKEILENLKNFDTKNLLEKETFAEIFYQGSYHQVYIINQLPNDQYKIYINPSTSGDAPANIFSFFGESFIQKEILFRRSYLNPNFDDLESSPRKIKFLLNKKLSTFNIKLNQNKKPNQNKKNNTYNTNTEKEYFIEDKNGKKINITGYKLYQFLAGDLLDALLLVKKLLETGSIGGEYQELFVLILDIIRYIISEAKNNMNHFKNAYYNRKLLITSKIHAILVCFDIIIFNIEDIFKYNYSKVPELEIEFMQIADNVYELISSIDDKCLVPWPYMYTLLGFIIFEGVRRRIQNYKKSDIFNKFLVILENLSEIEIKNIRKNSDMKELCKNLVERLFEKDSLETLANKAFYSFLRSCLKSQNLENKMNALNDISEIIITFRNVTQQKEFRKFVSENNILDIIFTEGIHDEIIKRSFNLFVYYAQNGFLEDKTIEKILERQDNKLMKKLLIKIISVLPKDKKDNLYYRLCKGIKFNHKSKNDIEYVSELTEACLDNSNEKNIKEKSLGNNNDYENTKEGKNYYGLNMIFDYIIRDFDDKIKYEENNVDFAVDSFNNTINRVIYLNHLKIDEIFIFIEKLLQNIKLNPKHNSIVQSLKIFQYLLDRIKEKKYAGNSILNLKALDKKYNILPLLLEDLMRYMSLLPDDFSEDKIYEGIYPHKINIEQRLKLIFYFSKKSSNNEGLDLSEKKNIEKVYQIFNTDKYKKDLKKFYEIFSRNINDIDEKIILDFFVDIIQNKSKFDLKNIKDIESINFIIKIFRTVNQNKNAIYFDGRNIRVDGNIPIDGFDMLFDLLTQNSNNEVQNKISDLLCYICINFKDYSKEEIIQSYWKKYYSKIITYLDNISKAHDKIAFNGIIKLLNKIYYFSSNCYGKIPQKGEYHVPQNDFKTYKFEKIGGKTKEKDYRLKAGARDTILELRWKLGYYYDIPVNNVTFISIDNKSYNINNDFELFTKVFNDPRYFNEKQVSIKVKEEQFNFLNMKDNPKDFIEKNETLYNILIDNLITENKNELNDAEIENKQKIWNIISKLPKNYFFINKLKQFGTIPEDKNKIKIAIKNIFNIDEIYIMTYSLQCLHFYLFEQKNDNTFDINEYLNNFIDIYSGDKYILDALINKKINKENCIPIEIECISIIINVLQKLIKHQQTKEKISKNFANENFYQSLLKKLTENISELLELNYTKYKNYLNQSKDDINIIISSNPNDKKGDNNINNNIAKLIGDILDFIEEISKGRNPYMLYMFNNSKLFTKIFVADYIKSEADESRKVIEDYLTKNFGKNNEYIKKYLEIILTVETFNYLVQNNSAWKYFHVISSIIKKYEENLNKNKVLGEKENKEDKIESQCYMQSKKIIDIILVYIQKECEKSEIIEEELDEKEAKISMKNKENFKEGILLFLSDLIRLNQKELVQYILNKVDVFDLFINKCLLRKCTEKPLEEKDSFCLTSQSQNPVYNLIIIILKNIQDTELYNKIIDLLNNYHEIGFWKTFNHKNWELDSKEMIKGKYVGLQNMSSTCYLNSIMQQLYMIPMLRESILKIKNTSKNNILYELQLLFSALKIYEFAYYDPRSFVVANKLNFYEQMDADEFYGTFIDKVENDIKTLYSTPTPTSNPEQGPKDNIKDTKNENYKYKNIFNYFFGIEVLDELEFVDCKHKRNNKFFYNSIQLEIKGFDNINDSLKNYFKTEVMDGDNKINCEKCKIKRNCHKHLVFNTLPNIFVIILKRFEFDYNTMLKYKLNKYFEFPFKLDMKEYLVQNNTGIKTEYELTGITIHYGVADFGHYYDLIKGPDGKWYKFNDISVSEFKEEDIPKEAYGEKEIYEEDSSKEKESGKNNAYILFYRKIDFDQSHIDKKMKNELALPPYSKYSNINEELKKEINYKLYKSWTIKNIASQLYQNFVISLIKFDIAKIKSIKTDKQFFSLYRILKEEKYINENTFTLTNNNSKEIIENSKIFEFALRYYFCVYMRISKRCKEEKMEEIFKQLIRFYLLTDINRAKYLLEEFCNTEVIEEYLIYCPNKENINLCLSLIIDVYKFVYDETSMVQNDTFVKDFLDTYVIFIDTHIRNVTIEAIKTLFLNLLQIGGNKFVNYLKRKNFNNWIKSFLVNEKKVNKSYVNTDIYPIVISEHCILSEKNNNNKKMLEEDSDLYEQQFLKSLNDNRPNTNLIQKLMDIFLQ